MDLSDLYKEAGIDKEVFEYGEKAEEKLKSRFEKINKLAELNQIKVIQAMRKERVSYDCLNGTTGYGYGDVGRDTLEKVYADVFHGEDALVRPQITCGTHAIALALFSNLRPGNTFVSIAGKPYDTLDDVIGLNPCKGSLAEYGVKYKQADLKADSSFDFDAIRSVIDDTTKVVEIQRSKGYATRKSFSVDEIGEAIHFVKSIKPDVLVFVDNCYGEFVEDKEPLEVGADFMAGSLIKNPGGGLAPIGGYIAGKEECIENAANRLTSPGLGREVGASLEAIRSFYQGFFMAPTVTAAAEKGAIFAAEVFEGLGYECVPKAAEDRHDIIQAVELKTPEALCAFCEGIQAASPIDSYVKPEPWDMPGYSDQVIMAAGTFVSGASIELSADGPLRAPYAAYFQGGLTYPHAKFGILMALQHLVNAGEISLK
ncbi:MAG: methionine gamma-lyase family protein [Lachnospiraceae bacterium]|nr:methionine gamma-lyase family protein [Lachnospiraceae bacterium]